MIATTSYILVALFVGANGTIETQQVDAGLSAEDCAYVLTVEENKDGRFACIPDLGVDMRVPVKTETKG